MHDVNSFWLYKLKEKEWLEDIEIMRLRRNRRKRGRIYHHLFSFLNVTGKLLVVLGLFLQKHFGSFPK
jgi:hypothetical protein